MEKQKEKSNNVSMAMKRIRVSKVLIGIYSVIKTVSLILAIVAALDAGDVLKVCEGHSVDYTVLTISCFMYVWISLASYNVAMRIGVLRQRYRKELKEIKEWAKEKRNNEKGNKNEIHKKDSEAYEQSKEAIKFNVG